jgi:hypothetical protein
MSWSATGSPELWFAWSLLLAPSDLVMARSMLRGIKPRAEAPARLIIAASDTPELSERCQPCASSGSAGGIGIRTPGGSDPCRSR